jgi:hypothetical protein
VPRTDVVFFRDDDGSVPALEWMDNPRKVPAKVRATLFVRVERLAELGHELRRPEAAPLRDGIYELRVEHQRVNYRLLYFFHQRKVPAEDETAMLTAIALGLTKEAAVPDTEIERAIRFRKRFESDPDGHTHEE